MHVLILDDNPSFARRVRDALKPAGHAISACVDAHGARASAKANPPALVLADADLDDIEGCLGSLQQVLAAPVHLVLVSEERGAENEEIRALCDRFGGGTVLLRPVPMLHLDEVLAKVLEQPAGLVPKPVEQVRERPVAPWDTDPNWGMDRPEPQVRTSRPVLDDPAVGRPSPLAREEPPPLPRVQRLQPPPPPKPSPEKIVNKANLRRLGNIWARRLSGQLTAEGHPGTALFADGTPSDIMSSIFARESVESRRALTFIEGGGGSNTSRHEWGQELLTRALTLALPDFLDRNGARALQPCSWAEAIGDLGLRRDLITLARSSDGYLPLFEHITAVGVDGKLGRELSALVELGILALSEPTRARVDKTRLVRREEMLAEPEPDLEATPRRRSGRLRMTEDEPAEAKTALTVLDPQRQLSALRKELAGLSGADAWTILGIAADSDEATVSSASSHLLQRYQTICANTDYGADVHRLAEEIAELVRYAGKAARPRATAPAGPDLSGLPPEQQLFERGRAAVEAEDWELAQKCLRKAQRLRMDDPRIMAWRGWAAWRLAGQRSGAASGKLRHEGMELMELADSWDASLDQPQLFLATAELESHQIERAEMRVQRLQRRGASVPGLERLAARVQAAKSAKD